MGNESFRTDDVQIESIKIRAGFVKMPVYVVTSHHGSYDEYFENIEGIYTDRKTAEIKAKLLDEELIVPSDKIYTIVPEDTFNEWPWNEDTDEYAAEYKDYTVGDYEAQSDRLSLSYADYGPCTIEEYNLNDDADRLISDLKENLK